VIRLALDLLGLHINLKVTRPDRGDQVPSAPEAVNNLAADTNEADGFGFRHITARTSDE